MKYKVGDKLVTDFRNNIGVRYFTVLFVDEKENKYYGHAKLESGMTIGIDFREDNVKLWVDETELSQEERIIQ